MLFKEEDKTQECERLLELEHLNFYTEDRNPGSLK